MDKFAVVDDLLLRGACPTPKELSILRDIWDVRRILSLDGPLGHSIAPTCNELGLQHLIVPLTDGDGNHVQELYHKIVPSLLNGDRAYVHCRHGKDRTGMVCAIYRLCRGWSLDKALREAHDFGMGKGLSPKVRRSYYRAVTGFANSSGMDVNFSQDIVEKQRSQHPFQFTPAIDNTRVPNYGRGSFAPYLDAQQDYLNRPASARVYIKCDPNNLLKSRQWWSNSPQMVNGNGKFYSAVISSDAKAEEYKRDFNRTLLQAALMKEPDVVRFISGVFVVDPNALVDIQEEEDINDALMVGQHDNYTGQAINVFPGSSGYGADSGAGGASGFGGAGFIFAPMTGLEQ
jgi:hypothetical protein